MRAAAKTSSGLAVMAGGYIVGAWAAGAAFSAPRPHGKAADAGSGIEVDAFFSEVERLHTELDAVASGAEAGGL